MSVLDQWMLWLSGLSAFMFLTTLIAMPFIILRLPEDFFSRQASSCNTHWQPERGNFPFILLRNILGWMLLLAGFLMLFLPGQGLLTILFGLALVGFPGKDRFFRWLLNKVNTVTLLKKMNTLRRHYNRPPLQPPSNTS